MEASPQPCRAKRVNLGVRTPTQPWKSSNNDDILACFETFSRMIPSDSPVVFFCDNQVALSWVTKGYGSKPEILGPLNALHLSHLHRRVWFEYVESKANIADIPSRLQPGTHGIADDPGYEIIETLGSKQTPIVLPPIPPSFWTGYPLHPLLSPSGSSKLGVEVAYSPSMCG